MRSIAISIILSMGTACQICTLPTVEETLTCLREQPKEDVKEKYAEARKHIDNHKTYFSLTTSPKRIRDKGFLLVLETLQSEYIDSILLFLPEKYKDREPYVIPDQVRNFPKLQIIQEGKDWGPIMKILPALERFQNDPDAIIIAVDDDTGYSAGMAGQLIKSVAMHDTVVGNFGHNLGHWGARQQFWPDPSERTSACENGEENLCDILEGFGGVAYKAKFFDVNRLKELSQLSLACKTSDDYVIHHALAEKNVPRRRIQNTYIPGVHQFYFGFKSDALHQGAGYRGHAFTNKQRYRACQRDIQRKKDSAK